MTQEEIRKMRKNLRHLTDGLLEPYHYEELLAFISSYTAEKALEVAERIIGEDENNTMSHRTYTIPDGVKQIDVPVSEPLVRNNFRSVQRGMLQAELSKLKEGE